MSLKGCTFQLVAIAVLVGGGEVMAVGVVTMKVLSSDWPTQTPTFYTSTSAF